VLTGDADAWLAGAEIADWERALTLREDLHAAIAVAAEQGAEQSAEEGAERCAGWAAEGAEDGADEPADTGERGLFGVAALGCADLRLAVDAGDVWVADEVQYLFSAYRHRASSWLRINDA
jgi:hypothetical protein